MLIDLQNIGHDFNRNWLFRALNIKVHSGSSCAIIGANGTGKSTLMQIIAGRIQPKEGNIFRRLIHADKQEEEVSPENLYTHIAWTAPMVEHYNVLTIRETFILHARFKPLMLSVNECIEQIQLIPHLDKPIKNLSSGMLQRVKIGLSLFTYSDLLLLDEPTSFMDSQNAERILNLIHTYQGNRTLILASNLPHEWQSINQRIILNA